ncbi:hypothetical protein ACFX13_018736 [Malus domestica]
MELDLYKQLCFVEKEHPIPIGLEEVLFELASEILADPSPKKDDKRLPAGTSALPKLEEFVAKFMSIHQKEFQQPPAMFDGKQCTSNPDKAYGRLTIRAS